MMVNKDALGLRILKIFKKSLLWQLLFLIFIAGIYFYFELRNNVEKSGRFINFQIERNLKNLFDYGEILYVQPTIEGIARAAEDQFPLYIVIKNIDDGSVQFFSGNPGIEGKLFTRAFSQKHTVSKLGNLEIITVLDYSQFVANISLFLFTLIILTLIMWTFLYLKISASLRKETLSFDELESILRDVDKTNSKSNSNQSDVVRKLIKDYSESQSKVAALESVNMLAKQVSHDIRSPLTALNMVIGDIKNVPEENRLLIRSAANRINDIANQLLQQSKGKLNSEAESSSNNVSANSIGRIDEQKSPLSPELLPAILDLIVSEKRVQYRANSKVTVETDFEDSYGAFALIIPAEFKRVISNLINNSIEAFNGNNGRIVVAVKNYSSKKIVTVRDNGKGIPPYILEQLGELGVSHGKEGTDSGSGLGIYHAKKTIESFGATFIINSRQNFGTEIRMEFPICELPDWFVPEIKVSPGQRVLALDDDESILEIWRQRIGSLSNGPMDLLTFTSANEFSSWIESENQRDDKDIYLMDFELLGQSASGLSLIEKYGLAEKAILVTSRYEELEIRTQCEELNVKILPKALATIVPFEQ